MRRFTNLLIPVLAVLALLFALAPPPTAADLGAPAISVELFAPGDAQPNGTNLLPVRSTLSVPALSYADVSPSPYMLLTVQTIRVPEVTQPPSRRLLEAESAASEWRRSNYDNRPFADP